MKTITLLRHAKSSWDDPGAADIDRPLAPRGKRDCKAAREVIASLKPELVLCSSARRTRETLERTESALPGERTVAIEARLYLASATKLLARLKQIDDAVDSVLMIGHNPGLQRLALLLAGRGETRQLARLAAKFPTAAIAQLAFSGRRWRDLDTGAAELTRLWTPKDGDRA